jgi:glucose-6-phosphate-specific signal transduction histidine kinase
MKRILDFWTWAAYEQSDSFLLYIVASLIPILVALVWLVTCIAILSYGHIIFSGVVFLAPIFFILVRGAKEYNRSHPTEGE